MMVLVGASGFSAPLYDPMTFVVTSNADPGDGICDADCTLREAIDAANGHDGADRIEFNIGGGGPATISPTIGFSVISEPVTIDATTQPGSAGTPLIELDGSAVPPNTSGFVIFGGGTTIKGFIINRFSSHGVQIELGGGNVVQGNYIGTNADGSQPLGNDDDGVSLNATANNLIGGPAEGQGNLISANGRNGVLVCCPGSDGNVIQGNFIGTDVSGTQPLGNARVGVQVSEGATGTLIGGASAGEGNLISSNGANGVFIASPGTDENAVVGNRIGVNAAVKGLLGNGAHGVAVAEGSHNTVGGPTPGARNVIAGNGQAGVAVSGGSTDTNVQGNLITLNQNAGVLVHGEDTAGNVVQGNLIGIGASGDVARPNGADGVLILAGANNNLIGGPTAEARNIISANRASGVVIANSAWGNRVEGNYIGTDSDGLAARPNMGFGVVIGGAAHHNSVGGAEAGMGNVISGNEDQGVGIFGEGSVENTVQGNYIGLDATGAMPLPNAFRGVLIAAGASNNLIGGPGAGNVISGNNQDGIVLEGPGTSGNRVQGNRIGTDPTGQELVGNGGSGIGLFDQASDNLIGGAGSGEGNLISGNSGDGIALDGAGTDGNIVHGNRVGTKVDGTESLGNGGSGVWVGFGPANTVIGGVDGAGNLISGNGADGVSLNVGSTGTRVQGNRIGTDWSGMDSIPNGGPGITIAGAAGNLIGGTGAGEGNVISGNSGDGLGIFDESAQANIVQGNYIGTDAAGASELPNGASGVLIAGGAHGNTIGGTGVGAGNLISGNLDGDGVALAEDGTTDNHLLQNLIGTNADGDAPLPNGGSGVWIGDGASDNHVGGGGASAGNLISGNGGDGVSLNGLESTGNHVQGNRIGTDAAGETAVANGSLGIFVSAAESVIGGTEPGEGNLISGNTAEGILLVDEATGNLVQGNLIGTDISGLAAVPNQGIGVAIAGGAHHNLVGGDDPAARNIISGNLDQGVGIFDVGAHENAIQGNYIGTDATGAVALPNTFSGVLIAGGAADNLIGGPGAGNVISGNMGLGIEIGGFGSAGNRVEANFIGTDPTGTHPVGNQGGGIGLFGGPSGNLIGGSDPGTGNVISGNIAFGVLLADDGTGENTVQGNRIGTDAAGESPLPNAGTGVVLAFGASDNLIGGTEEYAANVISANLEQGVALVGEGAVDNRIQGNFIGTDVSGARPLGNGQDGVVILLEASDNLIGGQPGAGNVIAFNGGAGVEIREDGSVGNAILANSIFANDGLGIDLAGDGVTRNDWRDRDDGPNDLQNYPFWTPYLVIGRKPRVVGFLVSEPRTEYRIELFANAECDNSGHGEGATFLAATTVTTHGGGIGVFRFELGEDLPVGVFFTATATNPHGSTSEFSRCVRVIFRGVGH